MIYDDVLPAVTRHVKTQQSLYWNCGNQNQLHNYLFKNKYADLTGAHLWHTLLRVYQPMQT